MSRGTLWYLRDREEVPQGPYDQHSQPRAAHRPCAAYLRSKPPGRIGPPRPCFLRTFLVLLTFASGRAAHSPNQYSVGSSSDPSHARASPRLRTFSCSVDRGTSITQDLHLLASRNGGVREPNFYILLD